MLLQFIKQFLKKEKSYNLLKRKRSYQHCKMSDTPPFDSFLKWKLGIESPSLAYAAKTVTRSIIFAVDVPYPLLKAWNELIKTYNNNNSRNVTNNTQRCADSETRTAAGTRLQLAPLTVLDFWP